MMIFLRHCPSAGKAMALAFGIFSSLYAFGDCKEAVASTPNRRLTHVEQIRNLSQTEAASAVPVKITGIITAFSGYKNSFFLEDKKFGISVDRTDDAEASVGDQVEVIGTSSAGRFAPLVVASVVRVLSHAALPAPRRMRYRDLLGGSQDSNWIEVEGVIHSARSEQLFGHPVLHLLLEVDGQVVGILLQHFNSVDEKRLPDSTVRIRGVCSTTFTTKRQFVAASLFVPQRRYLKVLQSSGSDPYNPPMVPIRNVFQFGQTLHRVKVVGVSTYQDAGGVLYLQQGNDGIRIQTDSKDFSKPGQIVEVTGFPTMGHYSPMLTDASIQILQSTNPVVPMHVEAGSVIGHQEFEQAPYDGQLVEAQGRVVEDDVQQGMRVLVLRGDNQLFTSSFPASLSADRLRKIDRGSLISVTGICDVSSNAKRSPDSFVVLMRSPDDVVVLENASWWTRTHTASVLLALTVLASATGLWSVILRYQVRNQTRCIRESEQRFRDLAETDVLTGLPNRLRLGERIAECIAGSESKQMKAAILTIDIDHFKQINDTYGHDAGDECLKTVAQRLGSRVRKTDTISRTGGEEFTEVIGCLADMDGARKLTNDILELFIDPVTCADYSLKITVSIGAALYPDSGTDIATLRKQSDLALYEAKRLGRNRVVFASRDLAASETHSLRVGASRA